MNCQKRDCARVATHAIKMGVPGILDPDGAEPRATVLLGVYICTTCLEDEDPDKWLESTGDTLRPIFTIAMSGGQPPDFDRAEIIGVPLNSPEGQNLQLQELDHNRKPN